ncbi:growth-regulating factor 2-like isoform X2 [Silene latifolia]|uniref:growth-regulating factor 2-like isoform X2 n=1 Tax=Silene latifolia TaxID=37657 RepID=UPI003D7783EE
MKRGEVVTVDLGLKLQENNNNNNVVYGGDACVNEAAGVLRNYHSFDLPSYYYSSGGMATAAMGFPFTAAQWKELERQAMIYKYMMASLPVPPDLLYSSFSTNLSPSSAFVPASYFMGKYGSGYGVRWSGNSKDAEPGRCRRTDGKKWRCSRDVAPNSKYCERHMHRGRPRSRKHVEQQQQQLLQQNHQAQPRSDLPINTTISNKANDSLTKKTRLNDQHSVGSCIVQPSKAPIFEHSMVSNANLFEDSRNLAWNDEQQWHHLMQTNMNSAFQHQLEGNLLNLNSNGGLSGKTDLSLLERPLIDAWSMGISETKENSSHGNAIDDEKCQIHMGLGLIDSWVTSTNAPGGPLAEVLMPGTATAVSSPSGVLQKTFATFSDSSGSNSPVCHNSNANSSMPFNWLG